MMKRVRVRRILAAADVAAGEANPELRPRRAERETFFASVGAGRDILDFSEMFALLGHGVGDIEARL